MARIITPFTTDELAGLTFTTEGTEDWQHLFLRALATIDQVNKETEHQEAASRAETNWCKGSGVFVSHDSWATCPECGATVRNVDDDGVPYTDRHIPKVSI